jgi:NAD(P)-dependent dehydrogenase (short-subunit alcohol dehydrogenase family)
MAFTLDKFRLDGKVAIVTGAGGRPNSIGEAYSLGLAAAGARVVCADLVKEGAEACADRVKAAGGTAIGLQVDISSEVSVNAMAQAAKEAFGGVDILVNNAALMVEMRSNPELGGTTQTVSLKGWQTWLDVNLTGAMLCARACIPQMLERGGGRIVNQVSAGAYPAQGIYGITKIALVGLTTTLAREVGKQNITVNAIAPGMTGSSAGSSLTPEGSPFRTYADTSAAGNPAGQPDDLVGPLLLLVSPAGQWMTGQVLHVDGGLIITN